MIYSEPKSLKAEEMNLILHFFSIVKRAERIHDLVFLFHSRWRQDFYQRQNSQSDQFSFVQTTDIISFIFIDHEDIYEIFTKVYFY